MGHTGPAVPGMCGPIRRVSSRCGRRHIASIVFTDFAGNVASVAIPIFSASVAKARADFTFDFLLAD